MINYFKDYLHYKINEIIVLNQMTTEISLKMCSMMQRSRELSKLLTEPYFFLLLNFNFVVGIYSLSLINL